MTDRITLSQIAVTSCHGVPKHEKSTPQRFFVDVVIECDLSRVGATDDLATTISYADVGQDIMLIMTQQPVDLIETLTEQIVASTLARLAVEAVEVTVHKPDALAGVEFSAFGLSGPAVSIRREQDRPVVIALGANLGDRMATLASAVRFLERTPGLELVGVSRLFETDPIGEADQTDYLNAVAVGRSRLAPWSLLERLHHIEACRGRTRGSHWGARMLDIDLIQVGDPEADADVRSDTVELMLPHPRAAERAFVLQPWLDVDPRAVLRCNDGPRSVEQLMAVVDRAGIRSGPDWSPL